MTFQARRVSMAVNRLARNTPGMNLVDHTPHEAGEELTLTPFLLTPFL